MDNISKKDVNEIKKLMQITMTDDLILSELFAKHRVYKALRDENGNGVVTGLTKVSESLAYKFDEEGNKVPADGELYYRGINIYNLVDGIMSEKRYGFEEVTYLLLTGKLPTSKELTAFIDLLNHFRELPVNFTRDVILRSPPKDIMNALARSVLTLYSYDEKADDVSVDNVFRQCVELIAQFPLIAVYSFQAYKHYHLNGNLSIRNPKSELSTAENILYMLKGSDGYSREEAKLLDICLILHMEHGGGNNSTFTTRVVTSSGTDTYSAVAAALGSLKGPKHGGANVKVVQMMDYIRANADINNDASIIEQLNKILSKEAFDKTGLIYGMGHAFYSLSDPRAIILKGLLVEYEAKNNVEQEEYEFYKKVYEFAPREIARKKAIFKGVAVNIDFFTGFIYKILKIPVELYTPIFAIARIVGWSAHRLEEIVNQGKIIRPAYVAVGDRQDYVNIHKRNTMTED